MAGSSFWEGVLGVIVNSIGPRNMPDLKLTTMYVLITEIGISAAGPVIVQRSTTLI